MQSSHEVNGQDFSGDIQAKKEWHKPEIMELVTNDGTSGTADLGADGDHAALS